MAQCAAHVLRVAGLAGTTGVREPVPRQTTGVIDKSKDANDCNTANGLLAKAMGGFFVY